MTDPVARSDALDNDLIVIRREKVVSKRATVLMFLVLLAVSVAGFTAMFAELRSITSSTNDAVTRQIPALERQVAEQKEVIADYEAVLRQAVDAILLLQQDIKDLGGTPREVVLLPPE